MRNSIIFFLSLFLVMFILYSCQSESELNYARYYTTGKQIYEQHCQNCHGIDGKGLAKLYPPLTDSIFLKKQKSKLVDTRIRPVMTLPIKNSVRTERMQWYQP